MNLKSNSICCFLFYDFNGPSESLNTKAQNNTFVIETCFGESCHLSCMSLVLKDLFPLEINCSNLYENESFSIPLSLKCLFYYNLSFLYQIYTFVLSLKLY